MKKYARIILEAAKLREESFDSRGFSSAVERSGEKGIFVRPEDFYKLSIWEAVDIAINKFGGSGRMIVPIYLLLKNTWNDILDWAEKYLE